MLSQFRNRKIGTAMLAVPFILICTACKSTESVAPKIPADTSYSSVSLSLASSSSSQAHSQSQTKELIPVWQNQWANATFTNDESIPGKPNHQQSMQLNQFIQNQLGDSGLYKLEEAQSSYRKLPDGTIFIVGEIKEYGGPSWALRMSSTGSILAQYQEKGGIGNQEFLGYADSFAYFEKNFGDGGGSNESVTAVDVKNNMETVIYSRDQFDAVEEELDSHFFPKQCKALKQDDPSVQDDIRVLAAQSGLSASDIVIGIPCAAEDMRVLPYSWPSHFLSGVAVRKANGDLDFKADTQTGASVYPPVYTDGTDVDLALGYTSTATSSGTYFYQQNYYWPSTDGISTDGYFSKQQNIDFCLIHKCVTQVASIVGR